MESYTFRCKNEDCEYIGQPLEGWTMSMVIDRGAPICQRCGDDLELVGPDKGNPGVSATESRMIAEEAEARLGCKPGAYYEIPRGPVNPPIGG